jgi:lipoyltransferase/lipoate-protein ligase
MRDAFFNMAIDEAILTARIQERVPNTLRFFTWNPSAVSIGRFQNASAEVHLENCKKYGVDVVRRITGGGAVYHDQEDEITYSVVVTQKDLRSGDVFQAYQKICQGLIEAAKILGVNADFNPGDPKQCPNVTANDRKISGSAQSLKRGVLLQHGTLLLNVDLEKMFTFLKVPWAKTRAAVVSVAQRKITSVSHETHSRASIDEAFRALVTGFEEALDIHLETGELTGIELRIAERLRSEKFSADSWNLRGRMPPQTRHVPASGSC